MDTTERTYMGPDAHKDDRERDQRNGHHPRTTQPLDATGHSTRPIAPQSAPRKTGPRTRRAALSALNAAKRPTSDPSPREAADASTQPGAHDADGASRAARDTAPLLDAQPTNDQANDSASSQPPSQASSQPSGAPTELNGTDGAHSPNGKNSSNSSNSSNGTNGTNGTNGAATSNGHADGHADGHLSEMPILGRAYGDSPTLPDGNALERVGTNGHAPHAAPLDGPLAVDAGATTIPEAEWLPMRAPIAARPHLSPRHARWRRRRFAHYMARSARARKATRARTFARVAWTTTTLLALLIVAVIATTVSAAAAYYESQSPLLATLNRKIAGQDSVRIYDSQGTLLYQFNDNGAQHSIPLAHIPVVVVNATIATEDKDFWINQGVDFQAIARAAYLDSTSGQIQEGASTITQQLIKQNVLNSDVTFTRKLKEAVLALGLTTEGTFTKRQLLEMYLNSIPYGPTAYGIDAAATAYFSYQDNPTTGESAAQHLDLAQATLLAGIPQSPSVNDPLSGTDGFQHARARQQIVLGNMVAQGYITQAQADAAWKEAGQAHFFHPQLNEQNLAPHFVYYVQGLLDQMISAGQLSNVSRTGLNVYTTLNLDLQNHVQQYMLDHLCGYDLNDYPGSPNRLIRDDNVTNASAVMADQHTGGILVLLGSMDYYGNKTCHPGVDGKFDVATQGFRGPGSSFKPFAYATAFQEGWFPAMTVGNEPTVFWDAGAGTVYKPLNADNHHLTPAITLRDALQLSQNIPAVKVLQFAGISNVENNVTRMGISPDNTRGVWGLSSVLGTLNVHLYDLVQAYTVFANYGQFIPMHAIDQITDSSGNSLYVYHSPQPVTVLSPQVSYQITSILSDNLARAPEFGRCSVLYLDPNPGDCYYYQGNSPNAWPAAAKTGTGEDLTDDWAMGYTMDYTMGVWVGNNNYTNMQWVDGVTGAAPIFYHSMLYAEQHLPKRAFPVPSGLHRATYTSNGVTTTDWFVDGVTPPPDLGSTAPGNACIVYHPDSISDPWDYCGYDTRRSGGG